MRVIVLLALAVCACAQPAPRFEVRDVRPQGAAEPHLLPGMGVWILAPARTPEMLAEALHELHADQPDRA